MRLLRVLGYASYVAGGAIMANGYPGFAMGGFAVGVILHSLGSPPVKQ